MTFSPPSHRDLALTQDIQGALGRDPVKDVAPVYAVSNTVLLH